MVKLLFTSIGTREINTSSVPKLREIKEVWCDYSGIYQSLEKRRPWKLTPPLPIKQTNHHVVWLQFMFDCWFMFHTWLNIHIYAITTFLGADPVLKLNILDIY